LTKLRSTFTRLSTLPIPTISAVASSAFGGGLELALCTDFRVLASSATVALPETRLAIIPGAGKPTHPLLRHTMPVANNEQVEPTVSPPSSALLAPVI
jgi:enoyl-CoA hydratase/carnithine racemase